MEETISIVIPAYNEQDRIVETLDTASLSAAEEIVVVCDGKDDTAKLARQWASLHPRLKVVVYQAYFRLGKGGAFKEGVKRTKGDQIFLVDADFPVLTGFVKYFSNILDMTDLACLTGSRYSAGSIYHNQAFGRKILSGGYRRLANWLFKLDVRDFQCGFKAFKREPLLKVLPDLKCEGFAFDVELLLRLQKAYYIVAECPVEYYHKKGSKVRWRQVFGMLWELLQIRHDLKTSSKF